MCSLVQRIKGSGTAILLAIPGLGISIYKKSGIPRVSLGRIQAGCVHLVMVYFKTKMYSLGLPEWALDPSGSLLKCWLNDSCPKSGAEIFNVGWLMKKSQSVKD